MAERRDRPPGLPFAQRVQNLRRDAWWFVVRIIQRLLSGSRGEVSALEQALRLQERLVIVAMVVASVVPALLLLASSHSRRRIRSPLRPRAARRPTWR